MLYHQVFASCASKQDRSVSLLKMVMHGTMQYQFINRSTAKYKIPEPKPRLIPAYQTKIMDPTLEIG
jgi:hypothetical protein